MSDCGCGDVKAANAAQRKTLGWLLAINALMFVLELVTGLLAGSTALVADSLDMFADATVYSIALYTVGRSPAAKKRAAGLSGLFQIGLALLVLADVVRRFVLGSDPEPTWMVGIGLLALAANVACLLLIAKHRQGEVHMRASWIFSKNDVIANLGVIAAGFLVSMTGSRLPDLVIGLIVAAIVLRGGIAILRDQAPVEAS
ncbi:cation transporter [Thermoleptolyngbya sp. M55_K2018_002]|uniref:cation transporter n=1 Tax=Thermoleptolyngbya sp. M55_K2018_002 TaxID=2747808 RepID=UPI0019E1FF8E|nr:cation transporter [Thermoleptolyngbya sp. M55_K2018_002]HIK42665.1 cation transporter [Thermoleptolyngbya sp. M55_K2018_002]